MQRVGLETYFVFISEEGMFDCGNEIYRLAIYTVYIGAQNNSHSVYMYIITLNIPSSEMNFKVIMPFPWKLDLLCF